MDERYFSVLKEFMVVSNSYKRAITKALSLDKLDPDQRNLLRECHEKSTTTLNQMYKSIEHIGNCGSDCPSHEAVTDDMEKFILFYVDLINEYGRLFEVYEEGLKESLS